ncbi:MAG: hypothetical protein M3Q73_02545 [bacterium]|nr:hypothetical protein [bacterium]
MATITHRSLVRPQALNYPSVPASLKQYNLYSFLSLALVALFILYFILPHTGVLAPLFDLNVVFILFVPAAALILSVMGIRQFSTNHNRGVVMSYIALGITTLYFMVALAIPLVLIGLYIIYTFIA